MAAIGRILLIPRGDWNATARYDSLDWVRDGGAAWVCKVDNTVGVRPTTSTPEWQLMAEDGTVGGWSSIANKPFETIGAGLDVNNLAQLEVAAKNTYIPTGTSSDRPISGQGVANALATELSPNYYTKSDIDTKLQVVVKYAGKKTFSQLTSSLLVAANENNFFMLSDDGYIADATALQMWSDNYIVGDHITTDSHIAVISHAVTTDKPYGFVFDDFGGFVEVDEFTSSATQANSAVVFDNLNPAYGYQLCFDDNGATGALTIPKYSAVSKTAGTNTGTIKLTYTIVGGTDGTTKCSLRILK